MRSKDVYPKTRFFENLRELSRIELYFLKLVELDILSIRYD